MTTRLLTRRNRRLRGDVLRDAILSLQPTAYWPMDDAAGPLRDVSGGGWNAAVTGSPTFGVAAPDPIARGITWSGTGQYATSSGSVPTPATSFTALSVIQTTDAGATNRHIIARGAAAQFSWDLRWTGGPSITAYAMQSTAAPHAAVTSSATGLNDGKPHLVMGTFDGTTIRCHVSPDDMAGTASSVLTATWYKASTVGITNANMPSGFGAFAGLLAHQAYWSDRVLSAATFRYLSALVAGG